MNRVESYNVSNIKQMVGLNYELVYFKCAFRLQSSNNIPFEMALVSQEMLDEGKPIEYRNVQEGYIEGDVTADKGPYQQYFLILKSQQPTVIQAEFQLQGIDAPEGVVTQTGPNGQTRQQSYQLNITDYKQMLMNIGLAVGAVSIFFIVFFYIRKSRKNSNLGLVDRIKLSPQLTPIRD